MNLGAPALADPSTPAAPLRPSSHTAPTTLGSICVYCGASDGVRPDYLRLAQRLGTQLAGSGVGLMGAFERVV